MSRGMEWVTDDPVEIVSKRAYTALRQIGKVHDFDPGKSLQGKIYIDGWPALLTVSWHPHRDGFRTQVDVSATSNDELSRAADEALYRFAEAFKEVGKGPYLQPRADNRRILGWGAATILIGGLATAYFLGWLPH